MPLLIRAAITQDKAILFGLYEDAMKPHIEKIWGWDHAFQVSDYDNAFQSSQTFVIENDNLCSGYFQIDLTEDSAYLRMLIVDPLVRSKGIGSSVLKDILQTSHVRGLPLTFRIFKINSNAKRFYEREGWFVAAEEDIFFVMTHPTNSTIAEPNHSINTARFAGSDPTACGCWSGYVGR